MKTTYSAEVTRTEIHSVTPRQIQLERTFRQGQADRKRGLPCRSANGAYLDGWYNPEKTCYFIPSAAIHLV
jgi:hypothetical protein